ncbi:MAG TPA: hypothetical protein VFP84_36835 [Kofleriaceae bacterium]|nr:hypothetical protein [Kofleriaceae bacterium]
MRAVGAIVACAALAACSAAHGPEPTGATCPSPDPMTLTWDSFGQAFLARYCTMCHASTLKRSQRNGAPLYHDYDTLMFTLEIPDHIDQYAGSGPAATNTLMPPGDCPEVAGGPLATACAQPSDDERERLSTWLACEAQRAH